MEFVPSSLANPSTVVGATLSGVTIVASTSSGMTSIAATLSGATLVGSTVMVGGTLSGTSLINATINSGSTVSVYALPSEQQIRVNRASGQTISTGTDTKVQHTVEESDASGVYDNATNYRMTPTISGTYLAIGSCLFINMDDNEYIESSIRKNGSTVAFKKDCIAGTGIDRTVICTAQVSMNGSTDYLEHYCQHNHGSDRNMGSGATDTYFHVIRISG